VKAIALAFGVAALASWSIGAAAPWVPRGALPDPSLLAAIALGLHVPGARGLVAAWAIGWQADLLSNGPLGVFAFTALCAWIATRLGERQLALARPVALIPFTAAHALAHFALLALLGVGPPASDPRVLPVLVQHVLVNALSIPFVARVFGALMGGVDAPEAPRAALRFDAGAPLR
jgi:hypothetical protein